MSESAYEIAALAMRFWLAALMVFLLWRIVRAGFARLFGAKDREEGRNGLRSRHAGGCGPETDGRGRVHPMYGRRFALKRENRIGSSGARTYA